MSESARPTDDTVQSVSNETSKKPKLKKPRPSSTIPTLSLPKNIGIDQGNHYLNEFFEEQPTNTESVIVDDISGQVKLEPIDDFTEDFIPSPIMTDHIEDSEVQTEYLNSSDNINKSMAVEKQVNDTLKKVLKKVPSALNLIEAITNAFRPFLESDQLKDLKIRKLETENRILKKEKQRLKTEIMNLKETFISDPNQTKNKTTGHSPTWTYR